MDENVTLEKLVLYYYNETELTDSVLVQKAIDTNYFVAEEYQDLKETFSYLDRIAVNPSDETINSILNYSKTFN